MCFAVKFCFRLYGLQAFFFFFFPLRSILWYSTQFVLLYQSQRMGVLTLCFNNVCAHAFIYSSGVQKDRLSFKHMPSTSGRLQSSRGNKEEVRQKASPWLQATVEAATEEFKISFFSKSIYSSTPLCSLVSFYSLQNTRKMHTPCTLRSSPSGPGGTFALVSPPFLREK